VTGGQPDDGVGAEEGDGRLGVGEQVIGGGFAPTDVGEEGEVEFDGGCLLG
jgi:hypothetical protein